MINYANFIKEEVFLNHYRGEELLTNISTLEPFTTLPPYCIPISQMDTRMKRWAMHSADRFYRIIHTTEVGVYCNLYEYFYGTEVKELLYSSTVSPWIDSLSPINIKRITYSYLKNNGYPVNPLISPDGDDLSDSFGIEIKDEEVQDLFIDMYLHYHANRYVPDDWGVIPEYDMDRVERHLPALSRLGNVKVEFDHDRFPFNVLPLSIAPPHILKFIASNTEADGEYPGVFEVEGKYLYDMTGWYEYIRTDEYNSLLSANPIRISRNDIDEYIYTHKNKYLLRGVKEHYNLLDYITSLTDCIDGLPVDNLYQDTPSDYYSESSLPDRSAVINVPVMDKGLYILSHLKKITLIQEGKPVVVDWKLVNPVQIGVPVKCKETGEVNRVIRDVTLNVSVRV
ncbi:MAG: hypothetical protein LBD55_12045 [Treponema sp.]|jgi:hypothetical protein|nr:hypothetical protein [Treponema sp.]